MTAYQSMPPQMPPTSGSMGGSPFSSAPPGAFGPPRTNLGPASYGPGSIPQTSIPGTGMPAGFSYAGGPTTTAPLASAASLQGSFQQGPMNSMPNLGSMPAMQGAPGAPLSMGSIGGGGVPTGSMQFAASQPPMSMPPLQAQGPPLAMSGQYMPNVARPQMVGVANPPISAANIQYGPSYKMQYQKRSTADKSAVKYTGFLPLEGVYEEDTCRVG
mmetsp:Transcript_59630/g.105973  ORF Transcript_59630/g.105973 Transcript_59630/m.105973 type:complete len:215 (+) Transcript_59630:50-694(+)